MITLYFDASLKNTKDLDLVFRDRLGESNQDTGLQSHLTMVLDPETRKMSTSFTHRAGPHARECRVLEYKVFDPAQAKGNDVGNHNSNHDKLYCFNRPP